MCLLLLHDIQRMARVLVVDDDSNVRQTLSLVLRRSGHEVEEAEDGEAALNKATRISYDAAVVDYQMPPPDGLELLSQLRDIQPRCVRVLMSGALELPVVINAVNRGEVSRVVQKPFARQAILDTLAEALAARARLEDLCVGARSDSFEAQRRQLEECLLDGVLALALQPIVAASDNSVQGYEALLRSNHGQLDSPGRIIAAAEAHDMLGRVADVVARSAARWLAKLPPAMNVFINVHPAELSDFDHVRRRFEGLREWSDRIVLEITERSHILKLNSWRSALDSLTQDGFRIAVDDLGAGYNSLSVLAELQPAFMKIDMSIVRHIEHDERKQRLVELLSRFAGATQTKLIVEGIETEEEASVVKRIGADYLQGYLFGRPSMSPVLAQSHAAM
jgi:EAL domain-containing protein (putative c-di-GMP-specific phosphodiesterase class I)/CheY-like chemotaxis protein